MEYLPHCLSMGIGASEFWNMNIRTLRPYLMAEDIKREQTNYFMWLQGLYVYDAMSVVIGNAFSKKGSKKLEYLHEPIKILPPTEEEKRIKAEKDRRKAIAFFNSLADNFNAKDK